MNKNWDLSPGLSDLFLTALMSDFIFVTWPVKTRPWADSSTWDGNTKISLTALEKRLQGPTSALGSSLIKATANAQGLLEFPLCSRYP